MRSTVLNYGPDRYRPPRSRPVRGCACGGCMVPVVLAAAAYLLVAAGRWLWTH